MVGAPIEPQFLRLHLPRPLTESTLGAFVTRLVVEPLRAPVVLEVRADAHGIRHLLGARPVDAPRLHRMLTDLIPGTVMTELGTSEPRGTITKAARLSVHPQSLPLRVDVAETCTRALLSALATPLRDDEIMAVQIVLGPRRAPRTVPSDVANPDQSLVHLLTVGQRPTSTETRNRLRQRAEQPGRALTIRFGVTSPDRARRSWFFTSMVSALKVAQSPGVRMELVWDSARRFNVARRPWWWSVGLSVPELVGLLGWPIGDGELPGLPPLHPKPLRAAATVHTGPRVFARSAAPGDDRCLGIAPQDQSYHGIAYGPTGSGKTTALLHLIMADIQAGRPVVVLDPKHQLIDDILARLPVHRLADVVELNAADSTPLGFNPLNSTRRDPDVVVDGILAVFEAVFAQGWGARTADIFSACLRTLARTSTTNEPATLIDLPRLLSDPQFRRPLVGQIQNDAALAGFWAWYEGQSLGAQESVIAAPLNKLRQFLLRPTVVRMLGQRRGGFPIRDTFRDNKIVLVPLNEGLIGPGTASLLGSLVIAEIWQATQERANEPGASNRPALVVIDEAPRFLHLPVSLADALAVSRSLGVGWLLAAQFREQFPQSLRAAIDNNARSKLAFASEWDDARDMARLAPELEPIDFMALPRFHAYANLVAHGAPSGWALVKTLPPTEPRNDPAAIRARLRRIREDARPAQAESRASSTRTAQPERIGRKPRHRGGRS
ncbi:type IV secretory system conjugative DNA transfer family protein [Actinokineospora sp. HUAS TT18]|uniref:type IV secretory system conjugative DNA transfer family protein n=1 Tax=Actinokineospora sp. HUAS TT18 TaxID=3447451 RepID=UPI003F51DE26